MHALRDALERSARATKLAEEHTVRALSDLQVERCKVRELEKDLSRLTQAYVNLIDENKRLRNLVGQACQDRHTMTSELQSLLRELRESGPPDPDPLRTPAAMQRRTYAA